MSIAHNITNLQIFNPGDEVNIQVRKKHPSWTGPVVLDSIGEGGIKVHRKVWYGLLSFTISWDYFEDMWLATATDYSRNNLAIFCLRCGEVKEW